MKITGGAKSGTKNFLYYSSQSYRLITNQMRLMPDFLIIGAQRSGTSSLYFSLAEHPYIVPPIAKELHFFDANYTKGLHWYRAQFPTTIEKYYAEHIRRHIFITGEASPSYLFHPLAPQRISKLMPDVKLIVLLRNPIDRAFSQHWYNVKANRIETLSFKEAIEAEPGRIAGEREKLLADESYSSPTYRPFSYLTRGIYVDQLQYWMEFYPKAQFLILRSEDFYSQPAATVHEVLNFLGVPDTEINANKEYKRYKVPNKAGYKSSSSTEQKQGNDHTRMDPELRKFLIDYFRPHNARLSAFLNRDFDWDK